MQNIMSIDVEDWFHPEALKSFFNSSDWEKLESRVTKNTRKLLELLEKYNVKATFFILGWVAEKYPELIQKIDELGHEIASHGYSHKMITQMNQTEFEEDLCKSLEILENIIQKKIIGFRAPTFSITEETKDWALPILYKYGIQYDSSVYPIHHDRYGIATAPRDQFVIYENGKDNIIEFPLSTLRISGFNMPFGGGGYLRLYPLFITKYFISKLNNENIPTVMLTM